MKLVFDFRYVKYLSRNRYDINEISRLNRNFRKQLLKILIKSVARSIETHCMWKWCLFLHESQILFRTCNNWCIHWERTSISQQYRNFIEKKIRIICIKSVASSIELNLITFDLQFLSKFQIWFSIFDTWNIHREIDTISTGYWDLIKTFEKESSKIFVNQSLV